MVQLVQSPQQFVVPRVKLEEQLERVEGAIHGAGPSEVGSGETTRVYRIGLPAGKDSVRGNRSPLRKCKIGNLLRLAGRGKAIHPQSGPKKEVTRPPIWMDRTRGASVH